MECKVCIFLIKELFRLFMVLLLCLVLFIVFLTQIFTGTNFVFLLINYQVGFLPLRFFLLLLLKDICFMIFMFL
jgi:hypothetical protein